MYRMESEIDFPWMRKVFFAKNHWGENKFIEIQYAADPNWTIDSGYYIKDVVGRSGEVRSRS